MSRLDKDMLVAEALRLLTLAQENGLGVGHLDRNEIAECLYDLVSFVPESTPDSVQEDFVASGCEEDEKIPFLSEAFLYPLLGKEDARTLIVRFTQLMRCLGFDTWPSHLTVERAVTGPWLEIEDRTEGELQRGLRLGHLEQVDGAWRITPKGAQRKERASETRTQERKMWGVEITSGPSAGTRIECSEALGFFEDIQYLCQRSWTRYRILLEPLEEGGEPEPLT